jgi:hypothetical protein
VIAFRHHSEAGCRPINFFAYPPRARKKMIGAVSNYSRE